MESKRQKRQRHHFVPEFYFNAWRDPSRKGLWVYQRGWDGKLLLKHRSARTIGFAWGLYSLKQEWRHSTGEFAADSLEAGFFLPLDTGAAAVHKKMLSGGLSALTQEDKLVWALFLNSLLERTPRRIAELAQELPAIVEESHRQWPRHLERERPAIDFAAMAHNSLLTALIQFIQDEPFVRYVAEMEWRIIQMREGAGDHFITSDSPLVVNAASGGSPILLLSIAISPKHLLVLNKADPEYDEELFKKLAMMHAGLVSRQAEKYVVSSRALDNSAFVKYAKIVEGVLGG